MRENWLTHQSNDFNSQDIINILPPVNSTNQISALLEATFNFSNSLPSWRLKGQSPQDAFMASRPTLISDSNIHMGPNLQAAGIHSVAQLREMAARGEEIPFTPRWVSNRGAMTLVLAAAAKNTSTAAAVSAPLPSWLTLPTRAITYRRCGVSQATHTAPNRVSLWPQLPA